MTNGDHCPHVRQYTYTKRIIVVVEPNQGAGFRFFDWPCDVVPVPAQIAPGAHPCALVPGVHTVGRPGHPQGFPNRLSGFEATGCLAVPWICAKFPGQTGPVAPERQNVIPPLDGNGPTCAAVSLRVGAVPVTKFSGFASLRVTTEY